MGYNLFIHGIKNPPAISDYNLQSVVTPRSGMMVQYKQVTRDTDRKCVVESGIAFATLVCTYKVTTHWEILTDELYSEAWNYNEVFKMNIVILAGLLVATLVSQSKGAAMIPEHPQTAFCKADFGEALSYKTFIPCYTHALDIGIVLVIFNVWVIFFVLGSQRNNGRTNRLQTQDSWQIWNVWRVRCTSTIFSSLLCDSLATKTSY